MASRQTERQRVVILGGGFAGLAAAKKFRSDRYEVTLIDRRPALEFLPNIHELLSGVKSPELLRLPLDGSVARAGHSFVCDTVTAVNPVARTVSIGDGRQPLGYDALILALGGVDATRGVAGVAEYAERFKSVDECARIGERLAELDVGNRAADVVIVGGGLEGVEALGEILRRYRENHGISITLVEARDRLLPEAPPALDPHVRELSAPYEVSFEMNSPVSRIEPRAVILSDGRSLPAELVIWTGGPAPPPLLAECGLAPEGAWAPVDVTLQSKEHPEVFVAGDAADLPVQLPKQAYHALDMGNCAADNVQRFLSGQDLLPFRPSGKPTLISFGHLSCFLVAGERVLAGPTLAVTKEAVFQLVMAQLDPTPWWRTLPRTSARTRRAVGELLWPTLCSPSALRRQADLKLLSS